MYIHVIPCPCNRGTESDEPPGMSTKRPHPVKLRSCSLHAAYLHLALSRNICKPSGMAAHLQSVKVQQFGSTVMSVHTPSSATTTCHGTRPGTILLAVSRPCSSSVQIPRLKAITAMATSLNSKYVASFIRAGETVEY